MVGRYVVELCESLSGSCDQQEVNQPDREADKASVQIRFVCLYPAYSKLFIKGGRTQN